MIHLLWIITRELRFQSLPEENEGVPQEPATITVLESDEVLKGSFLFSFFLYLHVNPLMIIYSVFSFQGLITNCQFVQRGELSAKFLLGQFF